MASSRLLRSISQAARYAQGCYEQGSGLDAVLVRHREVELARQGLEKIRVARRESSRQLEGVREEVNEVRNRLDGMQRSDPRFPKLVMEEHNALRKLAEHEEKFLSQDSEERDAFEKLSVAVTISHIEERAHAERTKYWGVAASLIGTALGLFGSLILSTHRTNGFSSTMEEYANQTSAQLSQFRMEVRAHLNNIVMKGETIEGTEASTESKGGAVVTMAPSSGHKGNRVRPPEENQTAQRNLSRIEVISTIGATSGILSVCILAAMLFIRPPSSAR
eukprot:jgi/Bigna1/75056/fgenesh1_pg.32_\